MNKRAEYAPHFGSLEAAARYLAQIVQNYDIPQVIAESEGGDPTTATVDEHLTGYAARDIVNYYTSDDDNGIPF